VTWGKFKGLFSSLSPEYPTPDWLFKKLDEEFHFDLDPAATPENAKCPNYYTKEQDGLRQPWYGNVFLNPPYGKEIKKWMKKAYEEVKVYKRANVVVALIPSRTDTSWWHDYVMKADEIRFIRGRLRFGNAKNSAPFPSAIVIWRREK